MEYGNFPGLVYVFVTRLCVVNTDCLKFIFGQCCNLVVDIVCIKFGIDMMIGRCVNVLLNISGLELFSEYQGYRIVCSVCLSTRGFFGSPCSVSHQSSCFLVYIYNL